MFQGDEHRLKSHKAHTSIKIHYEHCLSTHKDCGSFQNLNDAFLLGQKNLFAEKEETILIHNGSVKNIYNYMGIRTWSAVEWKFNHQAYRLKEDR